MFFRRPPITLGVHAKWLDHQELPESWVVLYKIAQSFAQEPNLGRHWIWGRSWVVLYRTTRPAPTVTLALGLSVALHVIRMSGPPVAGVVGMSLPPSTAAIRAHSSILRVTLQLPTPRLGAPTFLTVRLGTNPLPRLNSRR
jgi:hypothetical protein